jgi:GTP cyclohydrolase II
MVYLCLMKLEPLVRAGLPTSHGKFDMYAFDSGVEEMPHVALVHGTVASDAAVLVRIHSECLTGDVFGSIRCDCGEQLHESLRLIEGQGGVLVYLRQEGRGIGLVNKLKAYNLQDEGMDTISANHALGFHSDERDFAPAIGILKSLGVRSIRLLTNNPDKLFVFEDSSIEVVERIPLSIPARPENAFYLRTKKEAMGHWLEGNE